MPNPTAAALASQARSAATGNFYSKGPATVENASPMLAAWANQQSSVGWATQVYAGAIGLPRTFRTFREGQFSPLEPLFPQPIDIGEPPSGRPRPRRFQFPIAWNVQVGPPGTEGLALATFQQLREYAEAPSIPRALVEIAKNDLVTLDWDIIPTDDAQRAMQDNPKKRIDFEKRKAEAMEFFAKPDPDNYDNFEEWFNAISEDCLVIDGIALYMQPAGGRGNGPLGSNLGALAALDATQVKPLLDDWGARPRPPEPSFQLIQWGVPRVDLMDLINLGPEATIEDIKDLNPVLNELTTTVDQWDGDQLMYVRMNPRSFTPYGFSPIAQALLPAAITYARQTWQWEWFRSGSLPQVFLDPGESIATAEEARQLQDAINMLGGDLAGMHQVIVTPPGAKITPQKAVDLSSQFDEWLAALCCMPFGLAISDLGITPKVAAMQSNQAGKQQAQAQADRSVKRSTIPRAKKLKGKVFDRILRTVLGQADMQWSWGIVEEGESKDDQITQAVNAYHNTIASLDEARILMELDPLGEPWSTIPLVFTATGAMTLPDAVKAGALLTVPPPPPVLPPAMGGPLALGPGPKKPAPKPPGAAKPKPEAEPSTAHEASEAVTTTPAQPHETTNDTKSVVAELAQLRRFLRRGGKLEKFQPFTLHPSSLKCARGSDVGVMVANVGKAHTHLTARDRALTKIRTGLVADMTSLANRLSPPQTKAKATPATFVASVTAALKRAHVAAATAGSSAAASEFDGVDASDDWQSQADQRVADQSSYLSDFATDIALGMSAAMLASRIDMWGASLTPSYEQGYVETGMGSEDAGGITWHLGATTAPCALCIDRDGQTYTEDTLEGFPGDGGFQGDICEGGPNCGCWLELVQSGEQTAQTQEPSMARQISQGDAEPLTFSTEADANKDFSASSPLASGFVPFDLTGPGKKPKKRKKDKAGDVQFVPDSDGNLVAEDQAVKRFVTVAEAKAGTMMDSPPSSSADAAANVTPRFAGLAVRAADTGRVLLLQRSITDDDDRPDPAAGTWELPGGHLNSEAELPFAAATREWQEEVGHLLPVGQVVTMWTCPNGYVGFVYEVSHETDVPLGQERQVANPDGDTFEAVAWFAPTDMVGMPALRTELANDFPMAELMTPLVKAVKSKDAEAQPRLQGSSIDEDDVMAYLKSNYESADLGWVRRCLWAVDNVLLDHVDYQNRPGGLDQDKVAKMVDKLADGWQPDPVVLVAPDAESKMATADGHHRLAALAERGEGAARAWVGTPKSGNVGWPADVVAMQWSCENWVPPDK